MRRQSDTTTDAPIEEDKFMFLQLTYIDGSDPNFLSTFQQYITKCYVSKLIYEIENKWAMAQICFFPNFLGYKPK